MHVQNGSTSLQQNGEHVSLSIQDVKLHSLQQNTAAGLVCTDVHLFTGAGVKLPCNAVESRSYVTEASGRAPCSRARLPGFCVVASTIRITAHSSSRPWVLDVNIFALTYMRMRTNRQSAVGEGATCCFTN